MKTGGVGGAKTVTGLVFEAKANILAKLGALPDYEIRENEVYYNNELLALSYPKHKIYNAFLKGHNINYKDYVSKKYLPDEALFVPSKNTFYIIEMKFQEVGGSVDEKLQTCDFKKKIYTHLFSKLEIKVEFIFILNDFFDDPRLADTFKYINDSGCSYYFEELPLSAIDFPEPRIEDLQAIDSEDVIVTD